MAEKALQALLLPGLNNVYVNTPLSTAPTFNETQNYEVGDCVFYNMKLYKFISAHIAGAWDNSQVVEITIGSEIKQIENDLNNKYEKPSTGIPVSDLAQNVIPEIPVQDIQINENSVLNQGIANIPKASSSTLGVVKGGITGIGINNDGQLFLSTASEAFIKSGTNSSAPIAPNNQHISTFYGLAKAAGDTTQSASDNTVGTYTNEAKIAIRTMLGAVGNTDYASNSKAGIVGIDDPTNGIGISSANNLIIRKASSTFIKNGTNNYSPIVPANQHESVFYGLAKVAGDTTQSASDNTAGIYTDEAKTSIRSMIGAVGDVQINGTSVVNNGVVNIPPATANTLGVIKTDPGNGIAVYSNGMLYLYCAILNEIKTGTNESKAVTPAYQHNSVFYGLAKAAGDTTQASSSNAVGTYTDSAKDAIKTMLGIDLGSGNIQNVSGTTVTITGEPNARYICGEVATIDITPPASGTIIVRFTSGSTATVLTLPSTVKMPEWFDALSLEVDTIYELSITDGVYGAVMSWAV